MEAVSKIYLKLRYYFFSLNGKTNQKATISALP